MHARLCVCALSLLIVLPALVRAQAITGSLEGRVVSTENEPIEGAVITASGPFLQGTRSVATDERGRFLLLWLPAGTYTVQLRRMGFGPVAMPGVRVALGTTTSLGEVTLAPQALEMAEVVISGARPVLDLTSTAISAVMDSSFFNAIPTQRAFAQLAELGPFGMPSPFDSAQGAYYGANVAGSTEWENEYSIDGIHATEIGSNRGPLVTLPTDFVREVQVLAAGYEAEYGRAQGGVVNVVTRSGGNEFRGQVSGYYTGNALRSAPRWGYNELRIHRYANWDVGLSLGGPIVRDRLWFFAAYDPTFVRRDVSFAGIGPQQNTVTRHLFAGKLTWRALPSTELVAMVFGDPKEEERIGSSAWGVVVGSFTDSNTVHARAQEGGTTVALQARHWFGRSLLTVSLSRTDDRTKVTPRAAGVDLQSLTIVNDYTTGTVSGGYGYETSGHAYRTSAGLSFTHVTGPHTVKLGADYEVNHFKTELERWGTLTVTSDPAAPYNWFITSLRGDGRSAVPSAYVQDSWRVTRSLRVNVGLRWDGYYRWSGTNGRSGSIPGRMVPRLGVILAPGRAGAQKISLSAGRFAEQIPAIAASNWTMSGLQRSLAYTHNPLVDSTGGRILFEVTPGGSHNDPDTRGQYYDELTAGYQRVVGGTVTVGVHLILRNLGWVVEDAISPSGEWVVGNPGRGLLAFAPRARREYRAVALTLERASAGPVVFVASYVLSRNYGNYTGLFASDFPEQGFAANQTSQYDAPDGMVNATGLLPNDRTHLVKLVGSYRFAAGATVGGSFLAASGTPRSETGVSVFGLPYTTFVRQRGTADRTPWIWNLDLRFAYDLPVRGGVRPHVTLDVFHVGSARRGVWYDDLHYNAPANPDGTWPSVNPEYGKVKRYQQPMSARLGMVVEF